MTTPTIPPAVLTARMQQNVANLMTAHCHLRVALQQLTSAQENAEICGFDLLAKLTGTTADAITTAAQQLNTLTALARRELAQLTTTAQEA